MEVDIRTAVDDNDRQAKDIRELIAEGVDLLIVAPNEATPITPVVEEAYNRGIPVIVVDRKILSDKYTAYVGADNYEIGKAVGEYVANVLHGQGDVVEISGLVGSTPAVDRHQGFVKAISAYPGIRLLAVEDGAWLQLKAGEKMDTLLSRFPHIDLVYAQNDRMAAGAYAAAAREGREKDMRFIGIDALSGKDYGVEKVLAGELDATFIYPTGGDRVMQIAMDILNKRDFPRETILGTSVVDRDNAPHHEDADRPHRHPGWKDRNPERKDKPVFGQLCHAAGCLVRQSVRPIVAGRLVGGCLPLLACQEPVEP